MVPVGLDLSILPDLGLKPDAVKPVSAVAAGRSWRTAPGRTDSGFCGVALPRFSMAGHSAHDGELAAALRASGYYGSSMAGKNGV